MDEEKALDKKYLFLCGNNIDKALQIDVQRQISQHKDAKRLILFGNGKLIFLSGSILLSLFFLIIGFYELVETKEYLGYFTIVSVLAFILSVKFIYDLLSDIKSLHEEGMKLVKYFRYLISKERPRIPLDIWCHLPGSVADIQMINTIHNIYDAQNHIYDSQNHKKVDIDVMYTGKPYYDLEC